MHPELETTIWTNKKTGYIRMEMRYDDGRWIKLI
jgi:hypothetical protein